MSEEPVRTAPTFLFADLAGFTALTEAMGDADAVEVAEDFFRGVRELLPEHGAIQVKTIGDAVMIHVSDPALAIRLGLRVVQEVGSRHFFPTVRVGMHTGPAVQRGDDWFGASVNLAARVSGAAGGGEVLLTEATRSEADQLEDIELVEHGRQALKNVAEPVQLFRAVLRGGKDAASGLPIDPVCRMAVDPAHRAGLLVFEGVEYSFCSLDCAGAFAAGPDRYRQETV